MQTQLVNFTIPKIILVRVDTLAKREARSRSELFRDAIKRYLEEQRREKEDFASIKKTATRINLDENRAVELVESIRNSLPLNK